MYVLDVEESEVPSLSFEKVAERFNAGGDPRKLYEKWADFISQDGRCCCNNMARFTDLGK